MTFKSLFITIVLFSSFVAHSQQNSLPYKIDLQDVEGNIINSSDILLDTKYTLIEFWSYGCKPCIVQLNGFSTHKEEFDKRDVRIIAISQFEWDQKDADRMTKLGIEAYFDFTGKYFKKNAKFLQSSIPLTVIYDINGDKIFTKTGAPVVLKGMDPNAPDYTQKVSDAMLNNPSLLDLDIAKYLDILNK